jgi:DNA-binding MarR family transcriptional regulator
MQSREIAKDIINFTIKVRKVMRNQNNHKDCQVISEQKFRTLVELQLLRKSTLKDLSKHLCVSASSLCIMLNKLADETLVEREIDARDRRNTFYSLSPLGNNFIKLEQEKKIGQLENKINELSDEKKLRVATCLKELEDILEEIK